jgi:hypothetical protein
VERHVRAVFGYLQSASPTVYRNCGLGESLELDPFLRRGTAGFADLVVRFVDSHVVLGKRTGRYGGLAPRPEDGEAERETFAALDGIDSTQGLVRREVIERAQFIVVAPSAPVARRIFEYRR